MLPFPTPGGVSGRSWLAFTAALIANEVCANHSCGAVAEFHRASRTFRCGTKVEVGRLYRKVGRRTGRVLKFYGMRREKSKLWRLVWSQFRAALCRESSEEQAAQAEKKPVEVRAQEGNGDERQVVGAGWDEAGLLDEDFGVDEEEGGSSEGDLSRYEDDATAGGLKGPRELTERPEEGDEQKYRAVEALVGRQDANDEESGYAE